MRREWRERFPRHRGIAIPTCITARAPRTQNVRHARAVMHAGIAISFEVGGGETFPVFPAQAQPAILRIWQEAHVRNSVSVTTYCDWLIWHMSSSVMTSSNGNIFRVTGPLRREFTAYRWIPLTEAIDA